MATKRPPASTSPAPKTPVSFSSTLTISDLAVLTGTHPITIRSHSVIHPRARLVSLHGPVSIGPTCIISERASIGLLSPATASTASPTQPPGVTLADGVIIEVGAVVEAAHVGEGTCVEANARIHAGAVVGKHCHIGAYCQVAAGEVVADYTVLYGDGLRRIDKSQSEETRLRNTRRQVEVSKRLVTSKPEKFM